MKNKLIKIIIPLLLLASIGRISFAVKQRILINEETFSFRNKKEEIFSNLDSNYEVTSKDENQELKKNITELTKKTTYLLLGDPNGTEESSQSYFKRHQDYLNLRYNPKIPKDENNILGLDENSQEYQEDLLSGISVPGIFLMLNELDINYHSYGDIRVSIVNEEVIVSTITLPNVKLKEKDKKIQ